MVHMSATVQHNLVAHHPCVTTTQRLGANVTTVRVGFVAARKKPLLVCDLSEKVRAEEIARRLQKCQFIVVRVDHPKYEFLDNNNIN